MLLCKGNKPGMVLPGVFGARVPPLAEVDLEGGEEGSSSGRIFRIKDVKFLDSFLQVFCRLQFTERCSLIRVDLH